MSQYKYRSWGSNVKQQIVVLNFRIQVEINLVLVCLITTLAFLLKVSLFESMLASSYLSIYLSKKLEKVSNFFKFETRTQGLRSHDDTAPPPPQGLKEKKEHL